MQRLPSIILSILLGALAVGIGMGVFLHKANTDRQRLEQLAMEAQGKSKEAQDKSQQAIQEANAKLRAANDEVAKAQATLKAIEDERILLAKAVTLDEPKADILRSWSEVISLPLGLSLRIPPKNTIGENDDSALSVAAEPKVTASGMPASDLRWLQVTPYDQRLESELVGAMASTTPVMYAVHGRLLKGVRGLTQTGETYVLKVSSLGQETHLIWGRELGRTTREKFLLQVLATLTFKN